MSSQFTKTSQVVGGVRPGGPKCYMLLAGDITWSTKLHSVTNVWETVQEENHHGKLCKLRFFVGTVTQ